MDYISPLNQFNICCRNPYSSSRKGKGDPVSAPSDAPLGGVPEGAEVHNLLCARLWSLLWYYFALASTVEAYIVKVYCLLYINLVLGTIRVLCANARGLTDSRNLSVSISNAKKHGSSVSIFTETKARPTDIHKLRKTWGQYKNIPSLFSDCSDGDHRGRGSFWLLNWDL